MEIIKEYLDEKGISYIELEDGGVAVDVAKLSPEDLEAIKEISSSNTESVDFNEFWTSYHEITGLKKTDMQAAQKHWKKLTKKHRKSALEKINLYFLSTGAKRGERFIKKARTYLADKNFLDEFDVSVPELQSVGRLDGKPNKISITDIAVNNYAEYEQYCKTHGYDPETGESIL